MFEVYAYRAHAYTPQMLTNLYVMQISPNTSITRLGWLSGVHYIYRKILA